MIFDITIKSVQGTKSNMPSTGSLCVDNSMYIPLFGGFILHKLGYIAKHINMQERLICRSTV
jgi:hypothetical protein